MILSVHTGETVSSVEYHIHSVVSPEFRIEGDAKVVKFPGWEECEPQSVIDVHLVSPADKGFHLLTSSIDWLKY